MNRGSSGRGSAEATRATDAFARSFPALASRLAGESDDPSVERLVEGLGVLTGRVERALEATAPRAARHFADLLFPELLRPFPSATVLEISPARSTAHSRRFIDAGAEFDSVPVEGASVRFRAHAQFRIDPWRVEDARVAWSPQRGQALEVVVASAASGGAERSLASLLPLRFHIAGDPRSALTMLAWLDQRLEGIEVDTGVATVTIPKEALRLWGFCADEPLLPVEPLEHPGTRLLREWLLLPSKFAFFELAAAVDIVARQAIVRFRFDANLPTGLQVSRDSIRTNCVPVSNAFETTTDPLRPSIERPTHFLRPAGLVPDNAGVYSVRHVVAILGDGQQVVVPEAAAFARQDPRSHGIGYSIHGERGVGDDVVHCLELELAPDVLEPPDAKTLSVEVWATNRWLGRGLGLGHVCVPALRSPPSCTFRNISAVTPYRPAAAGAALRRATVAMLALSTGSLATTDALRTLLHALNLHVPADPQAARAHALRVEAIRSISVRPATQPLARAVARGTDVSVALAERAFDGEGEAFLFARVLARLFGHEASVNSFARTSVRLTDTGRTYSFPPLNGDRVVR